MRMKSMSLALEFVHQAYEYDLRPQHQDLVKNTKLLWHRLQNLKFVRRFKDWDFDFNIEAIATHIYSAW